MYEAGTICGSGELSRSTFVNAQQEAVTFGLGFERKQKIAKTAKGNGDAC